MVSGAKQRVVLDCDGGIDDFLALVLLMGMEEVEPLGVIVTPADCYLDSAVRVVCKLLHLLAQEAVPVAASTVRGLNPFPPEYRRDSVIIDHFPLLNEHEFGLPEASSLPGQDWLVDLLRGAQDAVTLMVTGPLTTVATALEMAPEIESKIDRLVWMGGALQVPGNVERGFAPEHDGSAEWNVYWDPRAADRVWQTQIPIIMCPLDLTNTVPLTAEFVTRLYRQRRYPMSDFAGLCYALAIPQDHYFWDVLATAYLGRPELYRLATRNVKIVTSGAGSGQTQLVDGGRSVQVMERVDRDRFYAYLLQQWAR